MNKKLFLTAMTVALTITTAQAATNISGVTGTNGVYNIDPERTTGTVGYRKYENFTLDKGDKANLNFIGEITEDGVKKSRDIDSFVNLVQNKVNINGVLNSVRDGAYYNGHAIFITPGGFVVGSSGVVNVGQLSVATPTAAKWDSLMEKWAISDPEEITETSGYHMIGKEIGALRTSNSGAADVEINGHVFTANGAYLSGKNVALNGKMVNGLKTNNVFLL